MCFSYLLSAYLKSLRNSKLLNCPVKFRLFFEGVINGITFLNITISDCVKRVQLTKNSRATNGREDSLEASEDNHSAERIETQGDSAQDSWNDYNLRVNRSLSRSKIESLKTKSLGRKPPKFLKAF